MGKLYTRRSLMGLPVVAAVAATGLAAAPAKASTGRRIQSFLDFVGQDPRAVGGGFEGWPGTDYHWGGSAASANLKVLRGSLGLAPVAWASWQLVWNPLNPSTSVRLVAFPPGMGANLEEFALIGPDVRTSPLSTGRIVTDQINALLSQGADIDIGHQARGNGVQGPLIFSSYLELVWEV